MTSVILASALLSTFTTPLADSYEWKLNPVTGSKTTVTTQVELDLGGVAKIQVNSESVAEVKSVDKDGNSVNQVKVNKYEILQDGNPGPQIDVPDITTTIDKTGKTISRTPNEGGDSGAISALLTLITPSKPIPVGQTLTQEIPANSVIGAPKSNHSYKGIGFEELDGQKLFRMKFTITAEGNATSNGEAWINTANGAIVKMVGELTDVTVSGFVADGKFTIISKTK